MNNRSHLYEESIENWLRALDDEFVVCWQSANAMRPVTYEDARKAIGKLIQYNISLATDECVNGGYRLVKVEEIETSVEQTTEQED